MAWRLLYLGLSKILSWLALLGRTPATKDAETSYRAARSPSCAVAFRSRS
jgi:hypothetical protein